MAAILNVRPANQLSAVAREQRDEWWGDRPSGCVASVGLWVKVWAPERESKNLNKINYDLRSGRRLWATAPGASCSMPSIPGYATCCGSSAAARSTRGRRISGRLRRAGAGRALRGRHSRRRAYARSQCPLRPAHRLAGERLAGIAVHIGARVAALAAPQEVLVSQTVRDLVAGSGLTFSERGTHQLKGVPGEWRLFGAMMG